MDAKHRGSKNLHSAEYRARLLTKLNCLIAVLEVAIAKISRSMEMPTANGERLVKVRGNLQNTLAICKRAKQTLEKGFSPPAPSHKAGHAKNPAKMTYRDYVEFSTIDEYRKFKRLPPIGKDDILSADWEDLARKLVADD